jgi:hypothetical protein
MTRRFCDVCPLKTYIFHGAPMCAMCATQFFLISVRSCAYPIILHLSTMYWNIVEKICKAKLNLT